MKLNKKTLKALITESLEEMHNRDHRDEMAMELESHLLSMVNGDREMAAEVLERLKDLIIGQIEPEPEYDEAEADYEAEVARANAEYEKRHMQNYDVED